MTKHQGIQTIHPFPARMANSIIWENLPKREKSFTILDPMAGSGTTLVHARSLGHQAIGFDTDPLALLIARSWSSDINPDELRVSGKTILSIAKKLATDIDLNSAYPGRADEETRNFIDYWFDHVNRLQLTALSESISNVQDPVVKALAWCAFSRLIITKTKGVSLAIDISHSRPHRKYEKAPIQPFDQYLQSIENIIKKSPFISRNKNLPQVKLQRGDARALPIESDSVDLVITSPPYLNAIDYMRAHKFSLVWMGYSISSLRTIRSGNIGTERSLAISSDSDFLATFKRMGEVERLESRFQNVVIRYLRDMDSVVSECKRVMKLEAKAVFVIGDSAIRGVFVKNSEALIHLAEKNGLKLLSKETRPIPESRRYLPPPKKWEADNHLYNRMREEVILKFSLI